MILFRLEPCYLCSTCTTNTKVEMIIPLLWTIPVGVVQAITNAQIGLNVLTEFIIGYMLPGRPLAMMMFKNYGYICMSQALFFCQDLKLGRE